MKAQIPQWFPSSVKKRRLLQVLVFLSSTINSVPGGLERGSRLLLVGYYAETPVGSVAGEFNRVPNPQLLALFQRQVLARSLPLPTKRLTSPVDDNAMLGPRGDLDLHGLRRTKFEHPHVGIESHVQESTARFAAEATVAGAGPATKDFSRAQEMRVGMRLRAPRPRLRCTCPRLCPSRKSVQAKVVVETAAPSRLAARQVRPAAPHQVCRRLCSSMLNWSEASHCTSTVAREARNPNNQHPLPPS